MRHRSLQALTAIADRGASRLRQFLSRCLDTTDALSRHYHRLVRALKLNGASPKAIPGTYKAKLTVNAQVVETEFEILKDPRTSGTLADIKAQFDFAKAAQDM